MTQPIALAPSPASDDSSQIHTPLDTSAPALPSTDDAGSSGSNSNSSGKRKPSRRTNTAERRATHNAVERARRETLNGRFLDLAALLPNLSQIRRPSKSAIVNSSIAHIHASRRHRLLASRELRLLKLEADALRRELNEWRDRAGIPRVEEPVRGDGFSMVLSGELEIIPVVAMGSLDGDEDGDYAYGEDLENDMYGNPPPTAADEGIEMAAMIQRSQQQQQPTPFAYNAPPSLSINTNVHPHMNAPMRRPSSNGSQHSNASSSGIPNYGIQGRSGPAIASPTPMSFDNPAMGPSGMMFDGPSGPAGPDMIPYSSAGTYVPQVDPTMHSMQDKWAAANGNNDQAAYLASLMRRRAVAEAGRGRSGSLSGSSSGSASPPQGWPGSYAGGMTNVGMGVNANMAMNMGGGGGMGNNGVAFAMM